MRNAQPGQTTDFFGGPHVLKRIVVSYMNAKPADFLHQGRVTWQVGEEPDHQWSLLDVTSSIGVTRTLLQVEGKMNGVYLQHFL